MANKQMKDAYNKRNEQQNNEITITSGRKLDGTYSW